MVLIMFYEESTLNNGIRVITERMEGLHSVAFGIWFRVGSRDERPGQSGISHFLEHMMFKGTQKRSVLDISMTFDSIGAELNAFTSKEYTCYYARTLGQHLSTAVEILSDMVTDSLFADDAIKSEREVVIEEIARSEDTPDDYVFELFSQASFPTHQLGRPILGTRDIVGAFSHDICQSYHDNNYHAQNATVVAVGNVNHQVVHDLCERYLSALPSGQANDRGAVHVAERERLALLTKDTEQAHIIWGMPGVPLADDDRYAMNILESALGGPMSSRLFQEVREKRGLAYAVFANTTAYMNAAQFSVYVGTRPANLGEVLQIIRTEMKKVLEKGLEADELARIRDYLLGTMLLGMEATRNRMIRLGRNAANGLELLALEEIVQRYQAVSLNDITAVAERVLSEEPSIAVVSPLTSVEVQDLLETR
jgi:predicted Zn-dependent peptidase